MFHSGLSYSKSRWFVTLILLIISSVLISSCTSSDGVQDRYLGDGSKITRYAQDTSSSLSNGDPNTDDTVDVIDARICWQYSLGLLNLTQEQKQACDVASPFGPPFNNTTITKADAIRIAEFAIEYGPVTPSIEFIEIEEESGVVGSEGGSLKLSDGTEFEASPGAFPEDVSVSLKKFKLKQNQAIATGTNLQETSSTSFYGIELHNIQAPIKESWLTIPGRSQNGSISVIGIYDEFLSFTPSFTIENNGSSSYVKIKNPQVYISQSTLNQINEITSNDFRPPQQEERIIYAVIQSQTATLKEESQGLPTRTGDITCQSHGLLPFLSSSRECVGDNFKIIFDSDSIEDFQAKGALRIAEDALDAYIDHGIDLERDRVDTKIYVRSNDCDRVLKRMVLCESTVQNYDSTSSEHTIAHETFHVAQFYLQLNPLLYSWIDPWFVESSAQWAPVLTMNHQEFWDFIKQAFSWAYFYSPFQFHDKEPKEDSVQDAVKGDSLRYNFANYLYYVDSHLHAVDTIELINEGVQKGWWVTFQPFEELEFSQYWEGFIKYLLEKDWWIGDFKKLCDFDIEELPTKKVYSKVEVALAPITAYLTGVWGETEPRCEKDSIMAKITNNSGLPLFLSVPDSNNSRKVTKLNPDESKIINNIKSKFIRIAIFRVDEDSPENPARDRVNVMRSVKIESIEEEPINFPDPNLEQAIREAINKPSGDIYPSDVEGLTELDASNRGITDLTGIEYCINLTELDLYGNNITNISPLNGLTNLEVLDLSYNKITDIRPLAGLRNLWKLWLDGTNISNINPLASLTNLRALLLSENNITDISPLSGLTNLEDLWLTHNKITDISPLAGLRNLKDLFLYENEIRNLGPLAGLTNLERLSLSENNITDISPLSGLANLEVLSLSRNTIIDISPLAGLTNLKKLDLDENNISDIQPLVDNGGLASGDNIEIRNNYLDLSEGSDDMQNIQTLINRGATVKYEPQKKKVIFVPNDYSTIQAAVNAASSGDTIIVRDGTYTENVDVNKDLTVRSENGANSTFVQAANSGDHVFEVGAIVAIIGFTIEGATATEHYIAGVFLNDVKGCKIANNNIESNKYGIGLTLSHHNQIKNNVLDNNSFDGISLERSSNYNTIENNDIIYNHQLGIELHDSSDNKIENNTVSNNQMYGVFLDSSSHNRITDNTISNNKAPGIELQSSSNNNSLIANEISNNVYGITVLSSRNNSVANNVIFNNLYGISLTGEAGQGASNNIFMNNTIESNQERGIELSWENNIIYLNNFINNGTNAFSSTTNTWHSPDQITYAYNGNSYTNYLGNYWSDYTGSDADGNGIGDTPYSINSDNDDYPLMKPFENYNISE